MQGQELLPGELAARGGVAISALHVYERESLITSTRTSGNQRRYNPDTLRRVAFIRMSQRLGIPLSRVRDGPATLPADRVPASRDWARLSAEWRSDLDDRILHLQRLRDNLADCIRSACLSLKACALFNPDDTLGPRDPERYSSNSNKRAIESASWRLKYKRRCSSAMNAARWTTAPGSTSAPDG